MKRFTITICIFAACLLIWIAAAPTLASFLVVEKPLERADAIIVLSGSAAYRERARRAAELYNRGVASTILISDDGGRGGWNQKEQRNLPFVEMAKRELISAGVADTAIVTLPGIVSGTDEEALAARRYFERHSGNSLLLVTSAHHTRRSLYTFASVFAETSIVTGVLHTGDDPSINDRWWWLSSVGLQTIGGELVKSGVYYLYY